MPSNELVPIMSQGKPAVRKNAIDATSLKHLCALSLLLMGAFYASAAMATEEPKFTVVSREGDFEIRQYAPFIVAETIIDGDMDDASGKGFRLIADFIFGNNLAPGSEASSKIAMTAPVTMAPEARSEKIAMTAPVTMAPQAASADMSAQRWRMHFVMPGKYTMATMPQPRNKAVTLREVPAKFYVVLGFSGFNTVAKVQQRSDEVLAWVRMKNLSAVSTPQLSRYDPPWTLPMWRRNEVMVEIAAPSAP